MQNKVIYIEWLWIHDYISETTPSTSSALFRTIIFVVLTLQATCYFSLLRYSRTRPNKMYFSSTAVFLAEVVKLLVTLVVIFVQCGNLREFVLFLINNLFTNPMATIKLSVPSVLYVVQNNLVYVAMTHLESTTFQVCTSQSMYLFTLGRFYLFCKTIYYQFWHGKRKRVP